MSMQQTQKLYANKNLSISFPLMQLTYGLTEKEITRKSGVLKLEFTDSVKTKVKEYIRHYMKKCGPIYRRTNSP